MGLNQFYGDSQRSRLTAVALAALATSSPIWACSGVGPPGQPVVFGNQTNIIIWDEANQTEHFIRNANFKSGADDFGFIAPTPSKPELSEASNQAFYKLASLAPQIRMSGGFGGAGGMGGGMGRSAEVQVIQEADVAGYHATTVWSKDAHAINDWMNDHGYVSTPEVEKWAERYCGRGWYLTAFKVTDKTKLAASTGTVRMSFSTHKPYNPFYVPASNIPPNGGTTLRLYFVSVGDYDAKIGGYGAWQSPQWTAPVPDSMASQIATDVKLPAGSIPAGSEVETFVDPDFPRPALDDIYFTKKKVATLSPARQSPVQGSALPTGAFLPVIGAMGLLAVVGRRRAV